MIARRALRELIAARTWREVLYALLSPMLGALGFAAAGATLLLTAASIGTIVILVPVLPIFLAVDRMVAGLCRRTASRRIERAPRRVALHPWKCSGRGTRTLWDGSGLRSVGR